MKNNFKLILYSFLTSIVSLIATVPLLFIKPYFYLIIIFLIVFSLNVYLIIKQFNLKIFISVIVFIISSMAYIYSLKWGEEFIEANSKLFIGKKIKDFELVYGKPSWVRYEEPKIINNETKKIIKIFDKYEV